MFLVGTVCISCSVFSCPSRVVFPVFALLNVTKSPTKAPCKLSFTVTVVLSVADIKVIAMFYPSITTDSLPVLAPVSETILPVIVTVPSSPVACKLVCEGGVEF